MNTLSKSFTRLTKFALVVVLCGLASAANVNTLSSSATGSSLVLLLKNSTDSTYFYAELGKTVSDLRTMAELQLDTPEKYTLTGDGVTGPLNEASIQSLNGYTNSNLAAYLAGNTGDNITWTIMGSKSAPQATAGAAAFAITSNVNFMDTQNLTGAGVWENQVTWTAANFFGNNFITDEINRGAWTNGQSTSNGWGSSTPNGTGAPQSFNGTGFENGAALGVAQSMYLLATTGADLANTYKSAATLTLGTDGVLRVTGGQPSSYTVSGTVSGLGAGKSVVLQNNSGDDQTVTNPASTFSFSAQNDGSGYSLTVLTQPVGQTCLVSNATGTLAGANVNNVAVTCTDLTYTVSGSISGLTASGLSLSLGGSKSGSVSPVSGATSYAFTQTVVNGDSYTVTVSAQPTGQTCTLSPSPATGTVGTTNIVVNIACSLNTYTISGMMFGLGTGKSVVLQNNGTNNQTVTNTASGFSFPAQLNGSSYNVTVLTQPVGQTCLVSNGSGTLTGANVSNVAVTCTDTTYTVSGSISGLTASGLSLSLSGSMGDSVSPVSGATSYVFTQTLVNGNSYTVTISAQPTGQTCTLSPNPATGTVVTTNIVVNVTCSTNSSSSSSSSVSSSSNSSVASSSSSAASSSVASSASSSTSSTASSYSSSSSGAVSSSSSLSSATSSSSSSAPVTYIVSGTVSGLGSGKSVVLQNNGANNQTVTNPASGFSFLAQLNGSGYIVTVLTQPVGQTCLVTNGSGTLAGVNVTNVAVTCTLNSYMVGGANVDGASLSIIGSSISGQLASSDNPYSFTALSTDMVTLIATKTGYTCTVAGSPITIGTSNVTTANVSCTPNTYTIGGAVSGLSGSVTLMLNNTEQKIITSNRSFRFSTQIPYQGGYEVKIVGQPIGQTCSITNSSGSVDISNISNVLVTCSYVDAQSRDASGGGVMDQRWLMLLALFGIVKHRRKHIVKTP